MDNDLYKPPQSQVEDIITTPERQLLYSPMQAALGALFGGVIAMFYIIYENYKALGKHYFASRTISYGILAFGLSVWISYAIPVNSQLDLLLYAVLSIIAALFVSRKQVSKYDIETSEHYTFQSNWRVLLIILVSIVASVIIMAMGIYIYSTIMGQDFYSVFFNK